MCTYADEQGGDGRTSLIVDHGQQAGEVTFSSSREAQPVDRKTSPNLAAASELGHYSKPQKNRKSGSPGRREQVAVDSSKGRQSHRDRHDDGEHSQQLLTKRLESRTSERLTNTLRPQRCSFNLFPQTLIG